MYNETSFVAKTDVRKSTAFLRGLAPFYSRNACWKWCVSCDGTFFVDTRVKMDRPVTSVNSVVVKQNNVL